MPRYVFDCAQRLHGCCLALTLSVGHGPHRACKPLGGIWFKYTHKQGVGYLMTPSRLAPSSRAPRRLAPLSLAPLRSAPLRSASIRSAPLKFLSPLAYAANNFCAVMLFHCPRITLRLAVLRPTSFPKWRGVQGCPFLFLIVPKGCMDAALPWL